MAKYDPASQQSVEQAMKKMKKSLGNFLGVCIID